MKTRLSHRVLAMVLCAVLLALVIPAYAAEEPFQYVHDPRLNPSAMADIVVDPTAVYGFAPSPEGSLKQYADLDWSDPEMVNGEDGRLARIAYHESIAQMYTLLDDMVAAGADTEEIARALSTLRNQIRLDSYADNPEGLADQVARNLEKYGHEEGPLPDELYEKYGSWELVIEKAFSTNSGMDACLGLYDDYYDSYVAAGQVEDERTAPVTREYAITILIQAMGLGGDDGAALAAFSDGETVSPWAVNALSGAVTSGLVNGYPDGTLAPQASITRLEAMVLLARCLPVLPVVQEPISFADVPVWAQGWIGALSAAGLVNGYETGILGAGDCLTVEQLRVLTANLTALDARETAAEEQTAPADPSLSLWVDTAPAKVALTDYMAAITDETGPDYIPVADRIAVFDLDGTLFCETDPNYFDYTLLAYRVLEDPDYKDQASEFEREVAQKIVMLNETGVAAEGLEVDHGRAVASAFAGMTVSEFNNYIQAFKQLPMPSYDGMLRGEGWYLPMLQIVDYLKENDFTVYIVSGTDRLIVRGIVYDSPLGLPNSQIIGSDETIISSNQGNTDGLNYVFTEGDELILGGEFLIKNLKMNKVSVIMQEIGQQPVLSFGNSTGDSSMAEYVTSGNPYPSLAFMLCCDDTQRENGSETKAQKMFDLCEEFDWVPVSMKNDWITIYGDGVTKHG